MFDPSDFPHSPYPVCVVQAEKVVFVNVPGLTLLGASMPGDLLGRHAVDFVPPELAPTMLRLLACSPHEPPSAGPARWTLTPPGGSRVDVELTWSHTRWRGSPATLVVMRAFAEDLPHSSNSEGRDALLVHAVRALPEGVIITLHDGRLHTVNPAALEILGTDEASIREALRGRHSLYVLPIRNNECLPIWPNDLPHIQARRRSPHQFELEICHPDGRSQWIGGTSALAVSSDPLSAVVTSFRDISEEREATARLRHDATHDLLTGLPNRRQVVRMIQDAIDASDRHGFSVMFVDLDNLKAINDSYGHFAGDAVLRCFGERIRGVVPRHSVVGRVGGDEFVIVLNAEYGLVASIGEDLHTALSCSISVGESAISVCASVGAVAVATDDPRSADHILRDADQAMYVAKAAGGSKTVWFDRDHSGRSDVRGVL